MTVDRKSLAWCLGSRLAFALIGLTTVGLAGLIVHTMVIEVRYGHNGLVHDVIREFFVDLAWGIPVFIGAVIMFGTWIVRRTMAPLRTVAEAAAGISPKNPAVRLPTTNVPSEVIPVVVATNAALARLQEAYVQQQRFIANAAHELRTPVAVFRAGLERLPPSSERIALLADVERLARRTAQLLDLARAERAGDEGTSDAVAVTRDVAAQLAPLAAGRGVTLAIEGDAVMPVRGGAEHVTPILRNLVENAIHHAPEGSEVVIGFSANSRLISVADAGPGVPPDMREAIFERFVRGTWTTAQGSGLGLSVAREAGARIGAEIRLEPASGGARFIVDFQPA